MCQLEPAAIIKFKHVVVQQFDLYQDTRSNKSKLSYHWSVWPVGWTTCQQNWKMTIVLLILILNAAQGSILSRHGWVLAYIGRDVNHENGRTVSRQSLSLWFMIVFFCTQPPSKIEGCTSSEGRVWTFQQESPKLVALFNISLTSSSTVIILDFHEILKFILW